MTPLRILSGTGLALCLATGLAFVRPTPAEPQTKPPSVPDGSYAIDPVHSTLMFKIRHANISWFFGRFADVSGRVTSGPTPDKSSVEIQVKLASVDTFNEDRDKHLKSPDFFDVGQFPTATFKSKKVAAGTRGLALTGDLSLHGVTKEVTLEIEPTGSGDIMGTPTAGFYGTLVFKRSDFGMKEHLDVLGDEVMLIISLEGSKKS